MCIIVLDVEFFNIYVGVWDIDYLELGYCYVLVY